MIRKYKALGLALMAVFAFGAFSAQGASATPLTVEPSNLAKVFITGTTDTVGGIHKLSLGGGLSVECTHALYKGSATVVSGAVNEITLTPEYTGCKAFGFATADVKHNGCTYTLTTPTKIVGGVTWHPSQIHVICPAGKKIEITPTSFGASVCTVSIGEQTPTAGHLVGHNAGTSSAMDITDEATVEGIAFTSTGGACGASGNTASFSGNTTGTCYKNEAHTEPVNCTFS